MTQKTLEKLTHNVLLHVELLKKDYKRGFLNAGICRTAAYNYTKGLYDAGVLTEVERRQLFTYITL